MTIEEIKKAKCDIEATADLLERAMKLSGLVTTLFQERGFSLVVVGGSAVEFYTEGGYMSGDIDFCRKTLKAVPPRLMQEIAESLGGKGLGRNWLICGLYVDLLGILETESTLPERLLETPYGTAGSGIRKCGKRQTLKVTVPVGCSADVTLPWNGETRSINQGTYTFRHKSI